MAEKKKKSSWGGARPGAGAKPSGIETAVIHHRVPVQYYSLIKVMIKSKLKELKENSNTEIKTAPLPVIEKAVKSKTPESVNNFLAQRRKSKLKIE